MMSDQEDRYRVRRGVRFGGHERYVVMQSRNGPCPLIAVANVLLLRGELDGAIMTGGGDSRFVTRALLTQLVADLLLARNTTPSAAAEHAAADVLQLLPSLGAGLDVNVRFTDGPSGFEFTGALSLFDLTGVPLLHGWLCDPQEAVTFAALGKKSFNEIVVLSTSDDHPAAAIYRRWLQETSSQMTIYGLLRLHEETPEGGLAVLFRNNHFSVVTKSKGALFMLVTDDAFADSPVIWERLQETTGDTEYLTHDFVVHKPSAAEIAALEAASNKKTQQQQQQHQQPTAPTVVMTPAPATDVGPIATTTPVLVVTPSASPGGDGDMALALQLQEHEEQEARQHQLQLQQQHQRQQHRPQRQHGGNDCLLL